MRKLILPILACASAEAGCVGTPPLSEATGSAQSNIMISDVVQRVKCELSEAFDEKTSEPDFRWLASWTAHADLTLTINDNAGISPSGSYTHFQENAVNNAAGPSSFPPSTARAVVNQFFTVSVGANLSGQAIRTETVSFTVALDELKLWREQLDQKESEPNYPQDKKVCNFGPRSGVTGNLGLKEWVNSAFFPVQAGELEAGIHSASAAKAPSPSVPQPGAAGPKAASEKLTVGDALGKVKQWQTELATLTAETKSADSAIDAGKTSIPKAKESIKQKIKDLQPFSYVLAPYLKERYSLISRLIDQYSTESNSCSKIQSLLQTSLADANSEASRLYDSLKVLPDLQQYISTVSAAGFDIQSFNKDYNALADHIKNFEIDEHGRQANIRDSQYFTAMSKCAKIVEEANALPDKLPKQVDPPIDSVLHSLTFVIDYGVNVSPSWTLLQWKGPGQIPNFFSASGIRTHILVLSMGPRAGSPAIGDDPIRLI